MKRAILILVLLFINTSQVIAAGYLNRLATGISINRYLVHSNGGITIWIPSSNIMNPDQCGSTSKVHIKGNLAGHNNMVSAVMTAQAAGQKIGFWSSGCSTIPFWGGTITYPIVANLWIVN